MSGDTKPAPECGCRIVQTNYIDSLHAPMTFTRYEIKPCNLCRSAPAGLKLAQLVLESAKRAHYGLQIGHNDYGDYGLVKLLDVAREAIEIAEGKRC
jgi:hypothetical protein